MLIQNNITPMVIFALVAMAICGILGAILGLDPFGPGQDVRAEQAKTQLAVEIRATENALSVVETPQAQYAQQTAVAGQLTALPVQQTATQVAGFGMLENAQIGATQTAIAGDVLNKKLADQATQTAIADGQHLQNVASNATATAIAQAQVREQMTNVAVLAVVGAITLTLCGWLVARAFVQAVAARAQREVAHTRLLAEQRRLLSLRASLKNQDGSKPTHPIPTSFMKGMGNVDKMPKAE